MNIKKLEKSFKLKTKNFSRIYSKRRSHLGGSFSMIEILIYFYEIEKKLTINLF